MKKVVHGGNIYQHNVLYDFSANINPLGTPKSAIKAMKESLKNIGNYPDIRCTALVSELSKSEQLPLEYIYCGNGAAELIFSLVLALKPKKALLQAPTFSEYEQALQTVDCKVRTVATAVNNFEINSSFLESINKEIDIVFLCNPNNPTGLPINNNLLLQIVEKCKENNCYLVVDECFQNFLEHGNSLKSQLSNYPNLLILKAFTKMYALAGARLGYLLTSNMPLMEKIQMCTQPWNVSSVAQAAGVACLKEEGFVEKTVQYVKKQRVFLINNLKKLGLVVYNSQANYLFFKSEIDMYGECLKRGILIRDCSNYPNLSKGYYRIAVRTSKENRYLIKTITTILEERT